MLLRKTERTARKPHRCTMCSYIIPAGSRYTDAFGLFEGEPCPNSNHLECEALLLRLVDLGFDDGVPPFTEILQEDWDAHPDLGQAYREILSKYGEVKP